MDCMSDDLQVTATERALLGDLVVAEVDAWIDRVLMHLVGARLAEVLFRAGRIDAVYGVATTDGRG